MRIFLATHAAAPGIVDALRAALDGHDIVGSLEANGATGVAQMERAAFLRAVDQLLEADVLVADVTRESHAVGWAIAWFLAKGRLVVLCCERSARARLSPMIGGNPSPWQRVLVYDDASGLQQALREALSSR